jgi:Flp pilus assembly protein TadG
MRIRSEKGTALIEAAVTIPILLLISVGIFEFGRAYQTWQVLTNAAREGARVSVLPASTDSGVRQRVQLYMQAGQLPRYGSANVAVNRATSFSINGNPVSASTVTVSYPFEFMVLQPVARMVAGNAAVGAPLTMTVAATMRNEAQ